MDLKLQEQNTGYLEIKLEGQIPFVAIKNLIMYKLRSFNNIEIGAITLWLINTS